MLHHQLPIKERFYCGSKFKFLVLSRREIKEFLPDEPCLVVSVTDPQTDDADIFNSPHLLGILRLQFDDVVKTNLTQFITQNPYDVYMTEAHADQIFSFIREHLSKVKLIICQCEQGKCRSAAIAAALAKILENENDFFMDNYWPNRWVYNLLIEKAAEADLNQRAEI